MRDTFDELLTRPALVWRCSCCATCGGTLGRCSPLLSLASSGISGLNAWGKPAADSWRLVEVAALPALAAETADTLLAVVMRLWWECALANEGATDAAPAVRKLASLVPPPVALWCVMGEGCVVRARGEVRTGKGITKRGVKHNHVREVEGTKACGEAEETKRSGSTLLPSPLDC